MIRYGWLCWEDIVPYKNQLIELEFQLIKDYHYPDRKIPISYVHQKVNELEKHLEEGNTFFWAITDNDTLIGYYWSYIIPFLNNKRWVLRSLIIRKDYSGNGYGSLALEEGLKKAKQLNCYDSSTEYVPNNFSAEYIYKKHGYNVSRIEVVKKL